MKSYTANLVESTASPMFLVEITDDDDSIVNFTVVVNNEEDLDKQVQEAYKIFKNPFKPE